MFPDKETRTTTIKALRGALPHDLPSDLRIRLSNSLGFIGQLSLQERLIDLFSLHKESLVRLFPKEAEDMRYLKQVRNFLAHLGFV